MAEQLRGSAHVPLLLLPVEIRLRIYELAYEAQYINSKLQWQDSFALRLHGGKDGVAIDGSPFTLLRVCRQLHDEIAPILPSIPEILFHLDNCITDNLTQWLATMADDQVSRMRKWRITALGKCQLRHITNGTCDRSLTVDLSAFEDTVDPQNFVRFTTREPRNRDFYKGFYLLRKCEGVVCMPKARLHPEGSIGQCNSVVDQQHAVANLVSDEGKVVVTRRGLVDLVDAVLRDEIPGGPGRRHLE